MHKKSFLYTANLFIRSLLFSVVTIIAVFFYTFACLAFAFAPLKYSYGAAVSYTQFALRMLKWICRVDYKITGLENIPKDRSGVILCKHQSTWETFLLPGLFNQPAIILKRELFWVPFFGWGLATTRPIAIDRKNKASAMEQVIKEGKKRLDEGRWILVFPEGTRIPPGKVGNYRLGGARLAVAAGCPVIPIAHNAGRFWRKRHFIKKPGTIQVVIGPLIETQNRKPEEVMTEAKNWIEQTMQKIDVGHA